MTVGLGYDPNGNETRRVDGNGNVTTTTFTPWNLPESTIEPSTPSHPNLNDRTWTTIYDASGRSVEDRLPGAVTRSRTFDRVGRLTAETGAGATTTARSLDYDAAGRVTAAASPAGNHTYSWYDRGLLATATGYGGTASYTYNGDGVQTARSDGAGTATFGYDDAGRVTSIVDPLTVTTATATYDAVGRPATVGHGSGRSAREYTYDNLGRLANDTIKKPDTTVAASIAFAYDKDNLLTSKTTIGLAGAGANAYAYDGIARVTSWIAPGGASTSYGYDAASNRTTVTTAAGVRTFSFDARNRITAIAGASQPAVSYAWAARGTMASSTVGSVTTTYAYDAFERLTQATKSGGYSVSFAYDSLDRPAQRGGASFGYHDLSNNPVLSPTAAGEAKLLRDPGGEAVSSKLGASAATVVIANQLHHDGLASVDVTTGVPSASADYDPYGTITSASGTMAVGYQGGWTDFETALTNAHARWYDCASGAFTSRDTLTLRPKPVAQANRYLYASGSPLNTYDVDGHRPTLEDGYGNVEFDTKAARDRAKARHDQEQLTCLKVRTLVGFRCKTPPPPCLICTAPCAICGEVESGPGSPPPVQQPPSGPDLTFNQFFDQPYGSRCYDPERTNGCKAGSPIVICSDPKCSNYVALTKDGQCAASILCLAATFIDVLGITLIMYAPALSASRAIAGEALGLDESNAGIMRASGTGLLPDKIAVTFSGARYTPVVLAQDTVLYRVGVLEKPLGQFFSTHPPVGVVQTRVDMALPLEWPSGQKVPLNTGFEILIPKGTVVYQGIVADQGGLYMGGGTQIVVVAPWNIPGVRVIASWPLH